MKMTASLVTVLASCPLFILAACNNTPLANSDAGMACTYAGASHASGSSFPSTDGCNTCICLPDGQAACTTKACGDGGTTGAAGAAGADNACGQGAATDGAPGWILFDSDRASFNRDIYMINADGSHLTRLTTDGSIEKEPSVSPDGRFMTFTSDRGGTMQIYLMDLASRAVTPVTNQLEGADQSSFSHNGTLITFHSGPSVYVVLRDGTGLSKVATGLDDFNAYFFPHFTLDDTGLVFDRNNEIDTVALDGIGLRMVIQNTTTTIKSPSVSPATGDIVYNAYCGGTSLWTAPFSTKTNACEGARLSPRR